jgi:hypothetical protein
MSDQIPTPPPASPYVAPAAGPKQGLSLTSFIVGLVSVVFTWIPVFGFLAAVAAVILGFIAKGKEPQAPKWMWIVGVVAGFVGILLGILFIVLFIVLPLIFVASVGSIPNY